MDDREHSGKDLEVGMVGRNMGGICSGSKGKFRQLGIASWLKDDWQILDINYILMIVIEVWRAKYL